MPAQRHTIPHRTMPAQSHTIPHRTMPEQYPTNVLDKILCQNKPANKVTQCSQKEIIIWCRTKTMTQCSQKEIIIWCRTIPPNQNQSCSAESTGTTITTSRTYQNL